MRFGLTAIKNVGEGAVESLLAVRKAQGHIASLHALCEELDLRLANKRVFESLVKAGAFDSLAASDPTVASLPTLALRPRLGRRNAVEPGTATVVEIAPNRRCRIDRSRSSSGATRQFG